MLKAKNKLACLLKKQQEATLPNISPRTLTQFFPWKPDVIVFVCLCSCLCLFVCFFIPICICPSIYLCFVSVFLFLIQFVFVSLFDFVFDFVFVFVPLSGKRQLLHIFLSKDIAPISLLNTQCLISFSPSKYLFDKFPPEIAHLPICPAYLQRTHNSASTTMTMLQTNIFL